MVYCILLNQVFVICPSYQVFSKTQCFGNIQEPSSFRNVVFLRKHWIMDKIQKHDWKKLFQLFDIYFNCYIWERNKSWQLLLKHIHVVTIATALNQISLRVSEAVLLQCHSTKRDWREQRTEAITVRDLIFPVSIHHYYIGVLLWCQVLRVNE
jgi:hypothetical protein